ncbi:MAG: ribosomal protein L23 [Candidatus Magasanikbacteria bacterium]|nr:ribosomal protein L23 [Candidatus Magasanikbacteria bacterium]
MGWFDIFKKGKKKEEPGKGAVGSVQTVAEKKAVADLAEKKPEAVLTAIKETAAIPLHLIRGVHVTEKSAGREQFGVYTFIVDDGVNKNEVAKAVQRLYGVHPIQVRMVRLPAKVVHYGRLTGKRSVRKHAIVTLKKGETLTLHEGV